MSYLHFGTDIRIENLMLLEAISVDDAEVIYPELDELAEALTEAGIAVPEEDLCDSWELRDFFQESGIAGFFGFACTPVIEVSECGKCIDGSWNHYARFPVYGKDIDEFKERAIEKVADYRKRKVSEASASENEE